MRLVFTDEELKKIDPKYFNIILLDGMDVTIQSRNTGHWWYLHCTGCEGRNAVVIFHRHRGNHPYHQHGMARSLRQAVRDIHGHDVFQLNERRTT